MSELAGLLLDKFGRNYSEILEVDLESGTEKEIFKWFLAAILFGAPINETSVIKTFGCFRRYDVLTPGRILETGWDGLVKILDEGGYTRYDFKTSDKLLQVMRNLTSKYKGSLIKLHEKSKNEKDLEERLKDLGKGIGDITVGIFLRELRGTREKANPPPTPLVVLAAKNLGIAKEEKPEAILDELKDFWRENATPNKSFIQFETALLRVGKDLCRKNRCTRCPFEHRCSSFRSLESQ